ncbi:hypothetical protein [Klebsiella sp. 141153]|uniref:hypothetical protein n=1 Tax=Klebsiella TaxID=570 RepID=UPI0020448D8C|nr:hypothetical protein [Klebsiella sp. 141153]MCM2592423.1 hypothetical protein [Klebsiella pneumoniae]MDU9355841.1 hypothetical protein [Klebsiella sp. 141153]
MVFRHDRFCAIKELEIGGGCLLRLVLTFVIVGASGGALVFLSNFVIAELISFTSTYLYAKGASMTKKSMDKLLNWKKNSLVSRRFRVTLLKSL